MPVATETPGFVPISEWPTLHDLCDGFNEHLLPPSNKLSGQQFELVFEDGMHVDHHFLDAKKMTWRITEGLDVVGLSDDTEYQAFEVRPNTFFVDFHKVDYDEEVSIVMNTQTGQAVVGISGFRDTAGGRRTYTTFSNAHIKGFDGSPPYETTDELIGKHVLYRYTGNDAYEHMYLNQGTFTWHCLSGTEKGLADTEPCKMLKLADQLYLLFWTEKIMPVESVVVVDLEQMRSTGRFFCWDPKPGQGVRTLFGSYATLLADTRVRKVVS